MSIITSKWEAVGSVVRTAYNEQTGGHLFVCDCYRRRDGETEFAAGDAGDAGEVAAEIARLHNLAVDPDYAIIQIKQPKMQRPRT